jgi:secreted trypsin-like serine protease
VITAAHCIGSMSNLVSVDVYLGKYDLTKHEENEVMVKNIPKNNVFKHEKFIGATYQNDVALIKLPEPLNFTLHKQLSAIRLPDKVYTIRSEECVTTGWGKLSNNGKSSNTLKEVTIPLVTDTYCEEHLPKMFFKNYHICAGVPAGGKDSCDGDSGGPLMCQAIDGKWVLIGITSTGDQCGLPGKPGIYTKVATYYNWIKQTMEKH